ncbi:ferric-chelate reductase [Umbelopsis sp. WA50703]
MVPVPWLLALSLLAKYALAYVIVPTCYQGCEAASQLYLFSNCNYTALDTDSYTACQCSSVPYLGSMALCYSNYCGTEIHENWNYLQDLSCLGEAAETSYKAAVSNATRYALPARDADVTSAIYYPVIFNQSDIYPTIHTINEYNTQIYYGTLYGGATNVVVFFFVFMGMINNLYLCITRRLARKTITKKASITFRANRFLRKWLINPTLFPNGKHSRQPKICGMYVSIPTRIESFAIFVFLVVNVVILFPNYRLFADNTYWPNDLPLQLCRYIADRSGIISFTQLPMIFLFAGRNNLLLFLTGWSYDRFTVAHKWISRTMFFHALVHSLAYTWYPYHVSGFSLYVEYFQDPYFQYGVAATAIGGFILWFGMPTFRRWSYEVFLVGHIVMVIGFTVGCWYHIQLLEDEDHMPWMYASISIWAFDRVLRFVRLIYLNLKWSRGASQACKVDLLPEDCMKLRIHCSRRPLDRLLPGAYVYIYIPSIYFWQSHPFTIASWSNLSKPAIKADNLESMDNADGSSQDSVVTKTKETVQDSSSTFDLLIRPQRGLTAKLHKKLIENQGSLTMNVLIEGPYGHMAPMTCFDTAIYIAGGVGISAALPYLQQAVYADRGITRHAILIFIVQTTRALTWLQDELCVLLRDANAPLAVDMEIYITRETESNIDPRLKQYVHFGGRPDLSKRIDSRAVVAPSSVAVMACGPPAMNDQVRASVSEAGIPYFEEAFTW